MKNVFIFGHTDPETWDYYYSVGQMTKINSPDYPSM